MLIEKKKKIKTLIDKHLNEETMMINELKVTNRLFLRLRCIENTTLVSFCCFTFETFLFLIHVRIHSVVFFSSTLFL